MATNKHAYVRYQILDECFRNTGRNYNIDDLLEKVNEKLLDRGGEGIKRRQLYDDIKFMRSLDGFSAEIETFKIGKRTYYRYANPNFGIRNEPINPAEAEHLKSAIQILSRFSGAPQFEWIEEMLPMLESKFGEVKDKRQIISYESNLDYEGAQFIQPLFHAIHNQRVLKMKYKPFNQPEEEYEFHPYFLKQFNNRWFVLGRNENESKEDKNTWNLALDRIVTLQETDLSYVPSSIDWEDHFYDIIGVTRHPGDPEEVVLMFYEGMDYVKTKPLHPTQKTRETKQGLEVRLQVIPNFELKKLILSFGTQVEVIAPKDLREKIANNMKATNKYYTMK